ncbi:MAG TPA: hypothetical protein ENJ32_10700, partial [Crenotrichaceae bacterium]|nr:hypothetical protein [Crenotrichaceae bacterium]
MHEDAYKRIFTNFNARVQSLKVQCTTILLCLTLNVSGNAAAISGNIIETSGSNLLDVQLKAFACAQGFGAIATGGRGGDVYHVTKLSDDGSSGTLRHALSSAKGPRTVVFDIGGNIKLNARLKIRTNNITLAGQTAPGDGITLSGYPLDVDNRSDIIIRYLRFRSGDFNARDPRGGNNGKGNQDLGGAGGDALGVSDSKRIMLDHISASWAMDENVSILRSKDVTIQNSIISEGLYDSFHPKGPHSRGLILFTGLTKYEVDNGLGGYTVYQNLIAHNNMRNPVVGGQMYLDKGQAEKDRRFMLLHFENNVVYNWGERSGHTGRPQTKMNYVNNYLIAGPSTKTGPSSQSRNLLTAMREENGDEGDFFIYFDGNYMDTDKDGQHNGHPVGNKAFPGFEVGEFITKPLPHPVVSSAGTAEDGYQQILEHAGSSIHRDDIDWRVIDSVINRTGRIIDSQDEVGGLNQLSKGTRLTDTDRDGMPDEWELANGLNPNNAQDRNQIDQSTPGYTNLEVYLDSIVAAAGHCGTQVNGNQEPVNSAPTLSIQAPADGLNTTESETITFLGSADDNEDGDLTAKITWTSSLDGLLGSGGAVSTTLSQGTHLITLSVTDNGGLTTSKSIQLTVNANIIEPDIVVVPNSGESQILDLNLSSRDDDVEEKESGQVILHSGSLDMVLSGGKQTVGLRYKAVDIPQNAMITKASIQFTSISKGSKSTTLIIKGKAADNASRYKQKDFSVSSAPTTSASVSWSPQAWSANASGAKQHTPDLASIIQEIVNRSGWKQNNALAFTITGSGKREAFSYDKNPDAAPTLHVEYVTVPIEVVNSAPTVSIQEPVDGANITVSDTVTLLGSADDTEDGDLTSNMTWTSSLDGLLGSGGSVSTSLSQGIHQITASVTDSAGLSTESVTQVTVNADRVEVIPSETIALELEIASRDDDVEEAESGNVILHSADLDMVLSGGKQTVGLRYNSVDIPKDATITSASIQFTAASSGSKQTNLVIEGKAVDNASKFRQKNFSVSSAPTTSASVAWSPQAWSINASGAKQRTPDLASIIQEIVNRPGWEQNNALAIIISGRGKREAFSYDKKPDAAPTLHVEYTIPVEVANTAPTVSVQTPVDGLNLTVSDSLTLLGSANDTEDGDLTSSMTWTSSLDGLLGSGGSVSTSLSQGTHLITASARDSAGLTTASTIQVTVEANKVDVIPPKTTSLDIHIASRNDDVEESESGQVIMHSRNLDMVLSGGKQIVGLRYNTVNIPKDAVITNASIQFTAANRGSKTTNLLIEGKAEDNASVFRQKDFSVSSAATTSASVSWSPQA